MSFPRSDFAFYTGAFLLKRTFAILENDIYWRPLFLILD